MRKYQVIGMGEYPVPEFDVADTIKITAEPWIELSRAEFRFHRAHADVWPHGVLTLGQEVPLATGVYPTLEWFDSRSTVTMNLIMRYTDDIRYEISITDSPRLPGFEGIRGNLTMRAGPNNLGLMTFDIRLHVRTAMALLNKETQ